MSTGAEPDAGRGPVLTFVVEALTENWGTKILAFLLALVVFIVTRDEVTRTLTVTAIAFRELEFDLGSTRVRLTVDDTG